MQNEQLTKLNTIQLSVKTDKQIKQLIKHYSETVEDWSEKDIVTLAVLQLYEDTFPIHIRLKH